MRDIAAVNPAARTLPELLTTEEAARLFGVHRRTIERWRTSGLLSPIRLAGTVRYRADDLAALVGSTDDHDPGDQARAAGKTSAGAAQDSD